MIAVDAAARPGRRLGAHLRGHLFLFDGRPAPAYGEGAGARLLLAAVLLESVRVAVGRLQAPIPPWAWLPLLLACALLLIRFGARLTFSDVGLRRWRAWTTTERSYFLQILVIANVVFPVVLATPLRDRLAQPGAGWTLWSVFVPYLFFGFYQELVYRGMLQLELARRWGTFAGIGVANMLYTFGPLHSYYFGTPAAQAVPMFASIFVMGLFFGTLFRRSGNLWIVAIMHAIGNSYIVGSLGPTR